LLQDLRARLRATVEPDVDAEVAGRDRTTPQDATDGEGLAASSVDYRGDLRGELPSEVTDLLPANLCPEGVRVISV
jgi:hypothetical protein